MIKSVATIVSVYLIHYNVLLYTINGNNPSYNLYSSPTTMYRVGQKR